MRIPSVNQNRYQATNMTPMIDVVFLLIIFFLVSSHLARQETRLPLDLPDAVMHQNASTEQPVLTINVVDQGNWQIAGLDMNETRLANRLAAHRKKHGSDAPIRIRTDRLVPYGRIEPILRISAQAGLWNAFFAVRESQNPQGGL